MVRSLALALSGAFVIASAHAGLQLTPKTVEYEVDGVKLKQLAFSDDGKTVTYQSPRGWDCSGNANQLTLHPSNRGQAEAIVTKAPLSKPGSFDAESLKRLVSEAVALAPSGSEDISVVSQEKCPLMIEHKETFLLVLSYTYYGQGYRRSILFLNRGNEQIRFQLTCRENDFKELHRAFLASQYSWQNL